MTQLRRTFALIRRFMVDNMYSKMLFMLVSRSMIMYGVGQISTPVLLTLIYNAILSGNAWGMAAIAGLWLAYVYWMVAGDRKNMLAYNRVYFKNQVAMQSHYILATLKIDIGDYDKELREGKFVELIDDGIDNVMMRFQDFFALLVKGATVVIIMLLVCVISSWIIGLLFMGVALLGLITNGILDKKAKAVSQSAFDINAELSYAAKIYYANRQTYDCANLYGYWREKMLGLSRQYWAKQRAAQRFETLRSAVMTLLRTAAYISMFVYALANPGDVMQIISLPIGYDAIHGTLEDFIAACSRIRVKSHIIDELDNIERLGKQIDDTVSVSGEGIKARHLNVSFDGKKILRDISLDIAPGEHVLIVGDNGSGKSTLMRVLTGLLKPDGGSLTINGANPYNMSVARKCGIFTYMPAREVVFPVSLFENVQLGNCDMSTFDTYVDLLKMQNIDMQSDDAYAGLSDGEKQRVGLMRTFMSNADWLLLDEPVSHLDSINRDATWAALDGTTKGVIAIAHDFRSTAQEHNPRVIWIRDGEIAADGKYMELLQGTFKSVAGSIFDVTQ